MRGAFRGWLWGLFPLDIRCFGYIMKLKEECSMNQDYVNVFAAGFVFGMGFMSLAVIGFVSAVRHLLHLPTSGPSSPQQGQ